MKSARKSPERGARLQRLHDAAVALGATCDCRSNLWRFNPNHYGPGPDGGRFAPGDAGGGAGARRPVPDARGDRGTTGDAGAQVAQDETPVPLGLPTARIVLNGEVAAGRLSQAEADQLLTGIAANDAAARARVNAALRGYVGIPENWTAEATGGDGGMFYRNPANPQYDNVRVMPGIPQSSNPGQREPYIIDQKSGNFLTTTGTRVQGRNRLDVHIPLRDYRFDER